MPKKTGDWSLCTHPGGITYWVRDMGQATEFASFGHLTRERCLEIQKVAGWDPTWFGCDNINYYGFEQGAITIWFCRSEKMVIMTPCHYCGSIDYHYVDVGDGWLRNSCCDGC